MRAAIYARYSTDLQREASIEDQVHQCRKLIAARGWAEAGVHADGAVSGASLVRAGLQALLAEATAGRIDVVVCEALDRLSRDQADIAGLFRQLTFVGVGIVTLAESEISELHIGLKGTMNALFLKDLAQKTRRGLEGRVRQGRSGGGLCFGYDVVSDDSGPGGRRINDAEANVVRRIFKMFAGGQSPRAIASILNAEGVPGPRGRAWSDTTIRGHATRGTGLLHNDLYDGRLIWNRQRYVKDPSTGKRLARPNPPEQWIRQEVPDLRIVDEALWQKVQARLDTIRNSAGVTKAREKKFWEQRRPRHLLTGLIQCGTCGAAYASIGSNYVGCSRARRQGNCSNRKSMQRSALEALILECLRDRLMQPAEVKAFIAGFHEESNRLNAGQDQQAILDRRELDVVSRKLDGLIEAITEGLRGTGLQQKLDELETRKAALEAKLSAAPPPAPRLHPNLAVLYRRKVEHLHEALGDPEIRQEAIEILRGLIETVTVTPGDDGPRIELVGDIVQMIALPKGSGGVVPAVYESSVKVVAGARNRHCLLFTMCRLPIAR